VGLGKIPTYYSAKLPFSTVTVCGWGATRDLALTQGCTIQLMVRMFLLFAQYILYIVVCHVLLQHFTTSHTRG